MANNWWKEKNLCLLNFQKPEFQVPEYPTHHLEVCNNRIVTFFFETTSIWVKSYLRYTTYCKYVVEISTADPFIV